MKPVDRNPDLSVTVVSHKSPSNAPDISGDVGQTREGVSRALAPCVRAVEAYLGASFLPLVDRLGGKNVGNELLKGLHRDSGELFQSFAMAGGFRGIKLLDTSYVETDVYLEFEQMRTPDEWRNWIEEKKQDARLSPGIARSLAPLLLKESQDVRAFFESLWERIVAQSGLTSDVFVRSSLLSEDFLNDQYTGVSKSMCLSSSTARHSIPPAQLLCAIYLHTLVGKLCPISEYVRLDEKEKLALQIAPVVDWDFHATAHCDEDDSVRIQVQSSEVFLRTNRPMWFLYEVSANDIVSVHPNFNPAVRMADWVNSNICKDVVNGSPSFLSEPSVIALAKLSREKKKKLGLQTVDTETLVGENTLIDVQIRPVMSDFGHEEELPPDSRIISETPFVLGKKFTAQGRLLLVNSIFDLAITGEMGDMEEFDPKKCIVVFPARDELFLPYAKRSVDCGTQFAGYLGFDYGAELSHMMSGDKEGQTHFARRDINFLADPHVKSRILELDLRWKNLSKIEGAKILFSDESFILQSDRRSGRLVQVCPKNLELASRKE